MHSESVGRIIYAKNPTIRSEFIHNMELIEAPHDENAKVLLDDEKEKEMEDLEQADEEARIEYAENFDLEDRFERNMNRRCNRRCKIPPNDRNFLMKIIHKEIFGGVYQTFPGNILLFHYEFHLIFNFLDISRWKLMWTRFLDTYSRDNEKRSQLLKIETLIFNSVKEEIESDTGVWEGSRRQNRLADIKVATNIYNSFKSYSRGMQYYGEFFNFKRF